MIGGRIGRDRMVVGFTTIYEIGTYFYLCCGFDSRTLCDKVCQWLAAGRWFSPVSFTNKTDRHKTKPNQPYEEETLLFVH
jgi:hypothetical protein